MNMVQRCPSSYTLITGFLRVFYDLFIPHGVVVSIASTQTPMVVYLASIGSRMSYRLGARRMMPPEPAKQVRVKSSRKRRSSTIAMYFQSSITSLSLSLLRMCWAMNWTPARAISTSGLKRCEETESCDD